MVDDVRDLAERLRRAGCTNKRVYGARAARAVAERLRNRGRNVTPYRCVFDHDGGWHIGPPPSTETVEALAQVIRARQNQSSTPLADLGYAPATPRR